MFFSIRLLVLWILLPVWQGAQAGTVIVESWRVDDRALWEKILIPAFERKHPGISVKFVGTDPTRYDTAMAARLASGTAGDIIACRPFGVSLALYRKGYLDRLNALPGLEYFDAQARLPWQSKDDRDVFCLPVASVIYGFFYNKRIFDGLGLVVPSTAQDFIAVLEAVRSSRGVVPLALGTADRWEATETLFTSIGPSWWNGEEGRRALVSGKARFTDARFLAALEFEARLAAYLGRDPARRTYADSQALFARGQAAVYPAGSWELAHFNRVHGLDLGAFPPPVARPGAPCHVSEHVDMGMGVNSASRNRKDAWKLLGWMATQEFADLYTNRAVGFFSLSNHLIPIFDPVAKQMAGWRESCKTTFRLTSQALNGGDRLFEQELRDVNAAVLNGAISPHIAARRLQQSLDRWYRQQSP